MSKCYTPRSNDLRDQIRRSRGSPYDRPNKPRYEVDPNTIFPAETLASLNEDFEPPAGERGDYIGIHEGIHVEFKECLSGNLRTISGKAIDFLIGCINADNAGSILFGVNDDGVLIGVNDPPSVDQLQLTLTGMLRRTAGGLVPAGAISVGSRAIIGTNARLIVVSVKSNLGLLLTKNEDGTDVVLFRSMACTTRLNMAEVISITLQRVRAGSLK